MRRVPYDSASIGVTKRLTMLTRERSVRMMPASARLENTPRS